jgi:hypothetical protein
MMVTVLEFLQFISPSVILAVVSFLICVFGFKMKKTTAILLALAIAVFLFISMILYNVFLGPQPIIHDFPFVDYYIIIDLTTPANGDIYIYSKGDETNPDIDTLMFDYENIAISILQDQYVGDFYNSGGGTEADSKIWVETSIFGNKANRTSFHAKEPERFKFKIASFYSSTVDTNYGPFYQIWHIQIIFPKGYKVDRSSCEGETCSKLSYSTVDGRDVIGFQTNHKHELKILYTYMSQ